MGGFHSGGLRPLRAALFGAVAFASAACISPPEMDLATNPEFYAPTGYAAKLPADRAVFVAPVVDARPARPEMEPTGEYTLNFYADGRWQRPPAVMVDEVLRAELASSQVFAAVQEVAAPEDCLMRIKLGLFEVGVESHVTGFRSFAAINWSVEILGPESSAGERPRLLEQGFGGAQRSSVTWVPPPAAVLMGMSLRQGVAQMLAALDQANVGRSSVPLDTSR